jgi:hypothetical protein
MAVDDGQVRGWETKEIITPEHNQDEPWIVYLILPSQSKTTHEQGRRI